MPEKLAELAGVAEGPAAGADGWHELAVAHAFISYRGAAECCRQLAAEIGELPSELVDAHGCRMVLARGEGSERPRPRSHIGERCRGVIGP